MLTYNEATSPRVLIFYGESVEDLAKMPTLTKPGEGQYSNRGLAPKGSIAQILFNDKLTVYMLGSNGWVDVTDSQIMEILM